MKELQLGKITIEELADWFGLAVSTVKNNKAKKLEILKDYAKFHFEKNKIIIDEIYMPVYSKAYPFIKEKLPKIWSENGLDTCKRVGEEIYDHYQEVSKQVAKSTAMVYTNKAKIELFGRNYKQNDYGTLGYSSYCWGVPVDKMGKKYRYLTPTEDKIVKECSKEIYGSVYGEQMALLLGAFADGEITEAEYKEGISNLYNKDNIMEIKIRFETMIFEKLGFVPERVTKITYGTYFGEE